MKADRNEPSPYASAQDVAVRCKELGITTLHIKLRTTGGPSAQSALRALALSRMKIDCESLRIPPAKFNTWLEIFV